MIKRILLFIVSIILIVGIVIYYIINIDGNFHKIDNDAYRSGFLNEYNLAYYIKKFKIKTVLNLRGYSNDNWYAVERNITNKLDAKLINYDMWSSKVYNYKDTSAILQLLKNSKKPILIHCMGGADRTSLVSAIYLYGLKNKTEYEARKQFAWYYGHLPMIRPSVKAMDKSFDIFVENYPKINE